MGAKREGQGVRFPDGSGRPLAQLIRDAAEGAVIELAPGRHVGPLVITKPLTLRGAGELTRLGGRGDGPVVTVDVPGAGASVVLESLHLGRGSGPRGGGLAVHAGDVELHNLHIERCRADAGGALFVDGGRVEATLLRMHDLAADRGGAIWVGGHAFVHLVDADVRRSEARLGGALALEGSARVVLEAVKIGRTRATTQAGGQAIWLRGQDTEQPSLELRRVRLEDVPLGMPVVVDAGGPGTGPGIAISASDLPRVVLKVPGVVDAGGNRWR